MKKALMFHKVVGTGNDFILVDARRNPFGVNPVQAARRWCDRKRGIGADGLLVVLPSKRNDARMRIFNPDGSEASMCGNGLRCVAWYLFSLNGIPRRSLSIETGAGTAQAQWVKKERVRLFLSPPRRLRLHLKLAVQGKRLTLHTVDTGVPHAALFVKHLDELNLASVGPAIRNHSFFKPAGTNVNGVRVDSAHRISIRTYERGVEAETLACGTGAAASAVVSAALGLVRPPVEVRTASGESLTVDFKQAGNRWEALSLEGEAQILFRGEIPS